MKRFPADNYRPLTKCLPKLETIITNESCNVIHNRQLPEPCIGVGIDNRRVCPWLETDSPRDRVSNCYSWLTGKVRKADTSLGYLTTISE